MKTILVDNEIEAMSFFEETAEKMLNITIEGIFTDSYKALQYVQQHEVDLVVLNTELSGMDGIELGKRIQQIDMYCLLIYVNDRAESLIQVISSHAVAFLVKPYKKDDILYAVESAYLLSKRRPKRIYARTFGYFDLFLDDRPIMFKSPKAKELLALLIDRQGGIVDSEQIIMTLWDGRPKDEATQSLCSKLCKTLYRELKSYGIEDLLITSRSSRSINLDMLSCDLYDMLEGKEKARKMYFGEYLTDYAWAEYRNYSLSKFV